MHTCAQEKEQSETHAHTCWACLPRTHLDGIEAVQPEIIDEVCRRRDLRGVHLLEVFQHSEDSLGHLLAVKEGL
jgi:hypothetical protein